MANAVLAGALEVEDIEVRFLQAFDASLDMPASNNAADARKSLAITGAPLNGRPPFTIALGPSISISAPNLASSLTCMKRDSKIRSVMMLIPGASVMSAIICA